MSTQDRDRTEGFYIAKQWVNSKQSYDYGHLALLIDKALILRDSKLSEQSILLQELGEALEECLKSFNQQLEYEDGPCLPFNIVKEALTKLNKFQKEER